MDLNIESDAFKQQKNDIKQSIQRTKPLQANPTVATIIAKVVTANTLENNKLIPVGKYGFALAGDVKLNYYQLLLYGSKNSILINLLLTKDFKYNVNENNSIGFLSKVNWHLEFENTNDAVSFNSQLAFVLWKLNGCKELYWADLYYPSRNSNVARFNSVVEITYVANTVSSKKFGPQVSSNIKDDRYLKVNINENGWERSLLGVNVNTQRIVFIPIAEMGAWKILTDGRQCLCLTMTVQNIYELKGENITDEPVIITQEHLKKANENHPTIIQPLDIVYDNISAIPSKKLCIESLYEEFEKLKLDNIKTYERLAKLEALIIEKKSDKTENSIDSELKKSMKIIYKRLIKEFPVDETFSGSEIQTKIKDIFYNILACSNQSNVNSN
ncbi:FK506-binding protein 15-like [Sipha flava]|jgi:hypothetical protein|uniref:FK506-binding protein 15 n=1 Tax=Sipha flava TaxID=143950 RepID=A0A2S2RAI6_9HEMI|nr:FK506-binding protein 15-like [Sipha flava]